MYNNIFDTHAHYTEPQFNDDRDELLSSMPSKGVSRILLAASDLKSAREGEAIARKYDFIYTAVGVHPECANEVLPNYLDELKKLLSYEKAVAVGEIGLDYHYENYDATAQKKIFEEQLLLAKELSLPVIIHSRDATGDCMEILKKHKPKGVVHCFSGSAETAKEIIKLGMHISFTGVLTFKNAKKAIEALEVVPIERLMLETDCPYMAPVPMRGKRCDSSMIAYTAQKAAEIKGMDTQELIDITTQNGVNLFLSPL